MKISGDQLKQHISKATQLELCYWLSSDEPFQLEDAKTLLRNRAKQLDFEERKVFEGANFDTSEFLAECHALSLFSSKKIIEIRLAQGKLNEAITKALQQFFDRPNPDIVLFIFSPKLEGAVQNSNIFKLIDKQGVVAQFWPITIDQYPKWLAERLQQAGLSASLSALRLFAELTEGNLLAAAQNIELLALMYPGSQLTDEQIYTVVAQQNHFDVFQLMDAFLAGDNARIIRIARNLKATDEAIAVIATLFTRELRLLVKLQKAQQQGVPLARAFQQLGIWDKKKPLYQKALQRPMQYETTLTQCVGLDQIIKGQKSGDPWLLIERLMLVK